MTLFEIKLLKTAHLAKASVADLLIFRQGYDE